MKTHTFRYRYTGEIEITVDTALADQQEPEEVANQAMLEHADRLLDSDHLGIEGPEEISRGVLGEVIKIGTWDRI